MSKYSSQLAVILVREVFGPTNATTVDTLMKIGRSQLRDICRSARLPEKVVSESLTVLVQNGLVRWVTVEDGPIDGTFYECFFEDVYPLIRYGKEISLAERHIGPEAGSLVQYINMQGHQKIKDIIAALAERDDPRSLQTLKDTLDKLLKRQYVRAVNWWNLMPSEDLVAKITLEEEKKTRGEKTTSAGLATKVIKEANAAAVQRIKRLEVEDKRMEGVKRKFENAIKPSESGSFKRRKLKQIGDDDDEQEEQNEVRFDFDDNASVAVDHKTFPVVVRNEELVMEVHKHLGPGTAEIYKVVLDQVQLKLQADGEPQSEICVLTSEIAGALPNPSKPSFTDLVAVNNEPPRQILTNGTFKSKIKRPRYSSDEEDNGPPEVKINGTQRPRLNDFARKAELVREHLQSLADDSPMFIRPGNGGSEGGKQDDEKWTVNLLALRQFIQRRELERIVRGKYGEDALRILRIISEKAHIDPDQFEKLILLKTKDVRVILAQLQSGGILEVAEIPKPLAKDRASNFNLWSFHESRARAFLLEDLYKTLIRIYQRIDEERSRKQGILAKASRTDVKKDLKRYLSQVELQQYGEWRILEERLLGQIMRVDKSIMLLRDV